MILIYLSYFFVGLPSGEIPDTGEGEDDSYLKPNNSLKSFLGFSGNFLM
jgi:hypothetical protein